MMMRPAFNVMLLLGTLSACAGDGFYGTPEEPPIPGERVAVLSLEGELTPDPKLANEAITLPAAERNKAWTSPSTSTRLQHLALASAPGAAWTVDAGEGAAGSGQLLARPVMADGRIFAMDAFGSIAAYDAKNGSPLWRKSYTQLALDDGVFGGGLALDDGRLFASFTSGNVISLNAIDGTEVWRQDLSLPLRSAPAISDGLILILTADNQVYALDQATGQPSWRHAGFFQASAVLGGPSPAVDRGVAIVPYSSAEVFALRLDNGRPLWSDTLERPRRTQALAQISDIEGAPVIDGDRVFIGGRGGQVAAIDIRRGVRAWDADLASIDTPWLAGDYIYLLTERNEVVCLVSDDGRIRWVTQLPRTNDPEGPDGQALSWRGPLLGGEQLILTSSDGDVLTLSPYSGEQIQSFSLPKPAAVSPIIADGTLYFLTEEAELLAYR